DTIKSHQGVISLFYLHRTFHSPVNNNMLLNIYLRSKNRVQMASILIRSMKWTLIRLNTYLEETKSRNIHVKALYGVSLLHKGAKQFGFDVIDLPSGWTKRWIRFFMLTLLIIVHPNGSKRLTTHTRKLSPMIIVSSTESFQNNIARLPVTEEKRQRALC
ncbi:fructosamine kinase family protein, partial [Sporolactobacillus putidus]|uniref:fructosamine kinase family protein n=1 Tax=Sporolactobacillus putidus TaxID=492735 RepID=UPI001E50F424